MALRSFREGDKVKAIVLSVDTEKRRISFGLKPSYFAEEDFQEESSEDEDEDMLVQPETLGGDEGVESGAGEAVCCWEWARTVLMEGRAVGWRQLRDEEDEWAGESDESMGVRSSERREHARHCGHHIHQPPAANPEYDFCRRIFA